MTNACNSSRNRDKCMHLHESTIMSCKLQNRVLFVANSGSVEICLQCLYLITLEVWKCGNMSPLSLSSNSGSVEMRKYVFNVFIQYLWKCGNVEIGLHCLYLLTKEMWKCGNMFSLSLSSNSGSVEMWKYVFIVFI